VVSESTVPVSRFPVPTGWSLSAVGADQFQAGVTPAGLPGFHDALLQQLLYAFGSLSDSDVFRWSEMLLDIVKYLHSGKRPSVREIAF